MKCRFCDWTPPLYVGGSVVGSNRELEAYTVHLLEHVIGDLRDVESAIEGLGVAHPKKGAR